jgi:hypothetical protein
MSILKTQAALHKARDRFAEAQEQLTSAKAAHAAEIRRALASNDVDEHRMAKGIEWILPSLEQ